jgi:hypothetical protein
MPILKGKQDLFRLEIGNPIAISLAVDLKNS